MSAFRLVSQSFFLRHESYTSIAPIVELVYFSSCLQAEEITNLKRQLNQIYVKHTGQDAETVGRAKERDNFMTPSEAMEFGLIDQVVSHRDGR